MKFTCTHSGECCTNPSTQIGLTLGDIQRICKHTGKTTKGLFSDQIGLQPFGDASENIDVELGLHIPCRFRKDNRCTIYSARPLNCRLFPYWILADAPKEKMKEVLEPGCGCCKGFVMDEKDRPMYKAYKEALAKIFLQEMEKTDAAMLEFNQQITISRDPDVSEKERIIIAKKLIDHGRDELMIEAMQKAVEEQEFAESQELNDAESLLEK